MDAQSLIPRLVSEFGYPQTGAQLVANKLVNCSPQVAVAFTEWWESGDLPELNVEGYTLLQLINEHNMKPIAAFLTLDWIVREPEKAKASLRKGHDRVELQRAES